MAWVEQVGRRSWRVRYRTGDGCGSVSGFASRTAAMDYLQGLQAEQRRGTWLDPAGTKTPPGWMGDAVDRHHRRRDPHRRELPRGVCGCHILPRWGDLHLGEISASAVTEWLKQLRQRYAASTVVTLRTILSMILDDAVDERLIPANPVRRRRRRGRRRDHAPTPRERVWATPEQVVADRRAGRHAGRSLGRAAGDHRRVDRVPVGRDSPDCNATSVDLDRGIIIIDPDTGALHESAQRALARATQDPRLGPHHHPAAVPRRPAARAPATAHHERVRVHQPTAAIRLRRSTFDRRVLRPAVDGDTGQGHPANPTRPDLPRTAAQPQDLAHRRRHPRNRPSPPTRPPPVQPARRDLQPRRTRSRTPTPDHTGAALAARRNGYAARSTTGRPDVTSPRRAPHRHPV